MKLLRLSLIACCALIAHGLSAKEKSVEVSRAGAWHIAGQPERVMIVTPTYWVQATFDKENRVFTRTLGGTSNSAEGEIVEGRIDFDSQAPQSVGEHFQVHLKLDGDRLTVRQNDGNEEVWTRLDSGEGALAGVWRISGRYTDGKLTDMPLRPRRTLKILSGTRFQWVAMNTETGEFSGTGGGTYTFEDGKYTEQIEFFPRDSSRVGAKLQFDAEVTGDTWQHKGLSSRGDTIHEVWTRFNPASAE
jgi:hypothetical protein